MGLLIAGAGGTAAATFHSMNASYQIAALALNPYIGSVYNQVLIAFMFAILLVILLN